MERYSNTALKGIRIVELSLGGVGTTAGKILADFGAEVIKVENPKNPDPMRGFVPEKWNSALHFAEFNRNKYGISVDLRDEEELGAFKDLINVSDAMIENFSPGTLKRRGIDFDVLKNVNPSLVMVSMSGLGQTGPYSHYSIWGPNLMPFFGETALWNHDDSGEPVGAGLVHPDFFAGIVGAYITMAALNHRTLTGEGHYIDASEGEAGASLIGQYYMDANVNKRLPKPVGNESSMSSPHGIYRCKGDNAWVAIAVRTEREWLRFRKAIGSPDWAKLKRFSRLASRVQCRKEIDSLVGDWTKKLPPDEVTAILLKAKVPAGQLHNGKTILEDEQLNSRGFWVETKHPEMKTISFEGSPIHLSDTPWALNMPAPKVGQHNNKIYNTLLGIDRI